MENNKMFKSLYDRILSVKFLNTVLIGCAVMGAQENWIAGGNSAGKLYCTGKLDCRWQFSRQAVVIRDDLIAPE